MAPLAIAKEKHFFFDEGLFVDLEAQSNWRVLLTGSSVAPWMGRICFQVSPLAQPSVWAAARPM